MFKKGDVPWNRGKKSGSPTLETIRKMRDGNLGKTRSKETCRRIGKASSARKNTWGAKVSQANRGRVPWNKGKKTGPRPNSVRRKIRLGNLAALERRYGQIHPNYNPTACRLIEAYGQQNGFHFQHAENGGEFYIPELGYWVDGYDAKQNVVIEVYEKRHRYTKERDQLRQQEIVEHLRCKFIVLESP